MTGRMARLRALLLLAAVAGLAAVALPQLEVSADITRFLPAPEDRELAELSRQVTSSHLNRTITLTVEAPDTDTAAAAGAALAARLAERQGVAWLRAGPDEALQQAFYELYYPRRLGLITDDPERIPELLSVEALRARVRELKERLASPTGTFVREIAPADPWLLFLRYVERLRAAQEGALDVRDGQFVSGEDGRFAVIMLGTEHSPFETDEQRRLQAGIADDFAAVNAEHGGRLELEQAGVHRLAIQSEAGIRTDITRVSVAGSVGVVLLILLLYRSPRYLLLAAVPLVAGITAAVSVCQLLFGSLHGLSLAFGATLIGVAIDYVAHYLSHHVLAPDADGPAATVRRIAPGLFLGALTTVVGLAGLAWTAFPGLREMAVLASVGVVVALAVTRWVLPPFTPAEARPGPLLAWLARRAAALLSGLAGRRRLLWILPAVAALLCALGAARLEWNDDIRSLGGLDPELMAEDARVRARVARMDAGRFVVATGSDEQEALERNDRLYRLLERAREDGQVEHFRSLHDLLWSAALQRENRRAIPRDAWERTVAALEAEGFIPAGFEPFRRALAEPADPLTFADIEATPLGRLASSFRVSTGDGVAILTFVHGVRDPEALASQVEQIRGVRWFDQGDFMRRAYGALRTRTIELAAAGLLAVFLVVMVRYRRLGTALAAFAPALVAALTTLAILSIAGMRANLLHVSALLLVLSMGVDYGVFMVESGRHEREQAPTLVGLVTACLSTVVSFGVLGMSDNPAMQTMGLTAGLGVALALVLAPAGWLLTTVASGPGGSEDRVPD